MKEIFYLIKKGLYIIKKEGFNSFLLKFKNYISRRILNENKKYKRYIKENIIDDKKKELIIKSIQTFSYKPLISIVTSVYNIDPKILKKTIGSVLNQIYENWEMCICDDGSSNKETICYLKSIEGIDKRIKIIYSKKNEGISMASNKALSIANGEYVAFLDHDDSIESNALYEIVKLLNNHPEVDLIYTDEDRINIKEKRFDPFFKPDFSIDLLLSMNYIIHLLITKKFLINQIGGFRKEYDGSQDYDLILRLIEKTNKIYHIPKVLYHWRTISSSAANSIYAKPYAYEKAKRAIEDYLKRNNIKTTVEFSDKKGFYNLKREIDIKPLISIIIPTKDKVEYLKKCIESILSKSTYKNYEIFIIDNNSVKNATKNYFEKIEKFRNIHILQYPYDFNFSMINNFAVSKANGEILLFLNNDVEIINKDCFERMLEHVLRKEVGVVGAKLLFKNNTIQHSGVLLGLGGLAGHAFYKEDSKTIKYFNMANVIRNYSAVTFACSMMRKDVFFEVKGFDENLPYNFNDVDLCLKVREKGYLIVYTPFAQLFHFESISRVPKVEKNEIEYIYKKWENLIDNDPYYNINLSRIRSDFGLREKPIPWDS